MVYLHRGESIYQKSSGGNILRVEYITDPSKIKEVRGTPQTIILEENKVGRPRIVPQDNIDNSELKDFLGLTIKGMSAAQKRTYHRLAQRKAQAKKDMMDKNGETAESFRKQTGKKIKDFTAEERKIYYKLNKQESRLLENKN
jgi:hypothetical protein